MTTYTLYLTDLHPRARVKAYDLAALIEILLDENGYAYDVSALPPKEKV